MGSPSGRDDVDEGAALAAEQAAALQPPLLPLAQAIAVKQVAFVKRSRDGVECQVFDRKGGEGETMRRTLRAAPFG